MVWTSRTCRATVSSCCSPSCSPGNLLSSALGPLFANYIPLWLCLARYLYSGLVLVAVGMCVPWSIQVSEAANNKNSTWLFNLRSLSLSLFVSQGNERVGQLDCSLGWRMNLGPAVSRKRSILMSAAPNHCGSPLFPLGYPNTQKRKRGVQGSWMINETNKRIV